MVRRPPNEYPGCHIKQSDSEAAVLVIWEMYNTHSLPSLPDQLWLGVVDLDRVLSMGQRDLNREQTNDIW